MDEGVSAVEYHERTKLPPADGGSRPDPANRPRDHKRYVDVPTRSLSATLRPPQVPTLATVGDDPPSPAEPSTRPTPDLETFTALCYYAAGVTNVVENETGPFRFRAASCTGALYHVDLYPVVGEDGPVPAGVYHFDPVTCSLEVLREGDFRGVLAGATGGHDRVADAPVTFVAASEWWRNAWKYRARTYRHAFWDSGTILANLVGVATALDLPSEIVLGFADRPVAELLGVDPGQEAPLELVPVGAGSPVPDPQPVDAVSFETEPLSPDPKQFPLIRQAALGSSLPDGEAARAWRERPIPASVTRSPGDGERISLDPVDDAAANKTPLPAAIRRRRSCREFSPESLNFRKVSTILDRAVRRPPVDVFGAERALQLTDCYLVVNAVEELTPGTYQYHPDAGELELLEVGEYREAETRLVLGQDWGGEAAVGAYFMADLDAVVEALGDRGYRAAQLEAALAGGRLYLATYAHRDLAGLGLTFRDDDVTEFFSPRAANQTPMFHYVFGRPA